MDNANTFIFFFSSILFIFGYVVDEIKQDIFPAVFIFAELGSFIA